MNGKPGYERIVMTLADARRDAAEIGDRELEAKLRDVQAAAIDRFYAAFDQSDSVLTHRLLGKRRQRVLQ